MAIKKSAPKKTAPKKKAKLKARTATHNLKDMFAQDERTSAAFASVKPDPVKPPVMEVVIHHPQAAPLAVVIRDPNLAERLLDWLKRAWAEVSG